MSNDTPDDDKNRKGEDAPQEAEAQATAAQTPQPAASKPKPAAGEKDKRRKSRRLSAALEVAASPPTPDQLAYLASEFILCTLPHSDPGDVRLWSRTNGAFTLALQPGVDPKTGESYGLPYGPLPRLLLAWLTWEAKRLGEPDIYLGESFAEFMDKLGLSYYTGGGCRGDAARLREQMRRLFHCLITFRYEQDGQSFVVRLLPVEQSQALWDSHARTAAERHGDFLRIILGQKFFDAITRSTVPLDMRVLQHVKHSPMALDLYAILVRESYLAQRIGKERFLAWRWLHERAGASYADVGNFRRKALPIIDYLLGLCPDLVVEVCRGGKGKRAGLMVSPLSDPVPRALQDRLLS